MVQEKSAAYKKHVESNQMLVWFTHGILDANSASHVDDPNYPNMQFEILFKNKYGVAPSGEFITYKLVKSFRDGMQEIFGYQRQSQRKKVARCTYRNE